MFPTYYYYSNLTGSWGSKDSYGNYMSISGNKTPDVWLGVIRADGLTATGKSESSLVNSYLDRAHKYRTGTLSGAPPARALGVLTGDDPYFSAPKSGTRGRGATGKAKVVVAVETQRERSGFATMQKLEHLSGEEISRVLRNRLDNEVVSRSDGWRAYGVLNSGDRTHALVIGGTGEHSVKVLPWVNTVIANVKGNIRGVYHGVKSNHLSRYLSQFCYQSNRRFWEPQMFDRILTACIIALP